MTIKRLLLSLGMTLLSLSVQAANLTDLNNQTAVGEILGWVSQKNHYNICGGYYKELPIPYTPNPLAKTQTHNYNIRADHTNLSLKGTTTLTGHVQVTQPDKQLNATRAYIYRDKKTHKADHIKLYGKVKLIQPGNLIAAHWASLNLANKTAVLHHAAYRMNLADTKRISAKNAKNRREFHLYNQNFWGTAETITQTKPKHFVLKKAVYTTCTPSNDTWRIHSTSIALNQQTNEGTAWNSVLYWKNVPVFYYPYLSFPLKAMRKSGFLMPSYGTSERAGVSFNLPFYWNIAPNYDALFSADYMSKRGIMAKARTRYLTQSSNGSLKLAFLPHDRAFASFKNADLTSTKYQNQPEGLSHLRHDSDNRYAIDWLQNTTISPHTSLQVNFNKASDDYYMQDFSSHGLSVTDNQLLQKATLSYQGSTWNLNTLVQRYQTLHPINETINANQYERLPEIQANGYYPQIWHNLNFSLGTDAVRFFQSRTPDTITMPVVGGRLHLAPAIDYPIVRPFGFLTPRIQLELTKYQLRQVGGLTSKNPGVAIPIVDVHGGLYFDRQYHFFGHDYLQTLEPELYYLYVPYHKQNNLPIFDTTAQTFDYSYLFLDNRFSGIDRIGDANQITLGITTRFIDNETGDQKGAISIGEQYYFRNRRVQLCSKSDANCHMPLPSTDKQRLSPVSAAGTYDFDRHWHTNANITWNQNKHRVSNSAINAQYRPDNNHIFNIGYSFVRADNSANELKQTNMSVYWQFKHHWDAVGAWNYNWTYNRGNAYMAGIGYESCCWAVRAVAVRSFVRVDNQNKLRYNNAYFAQLVLKGLGGVSNSDPAGPLQQYVAGYSDDFEQIGTT
jgi:LPS-assembly protein